MIFGKFDRKSGLSEIEKLGKSDLSVRIELNYKRRLSHDETIVA
jgi:hypothetical protein